MSTHYGTTAMPYTPTKLETIADNLAKNWGIALPELLPVKGMKYKWHMTKKVSGNNVEIKYLRVPPKAIRESPGQVPEILNAIYAAEPEKEELQLNLDGKIMKIGFEYNAVEEDVVVAKVDGVETNMDQVISLLAKLTNYNK